MNRRSGKYLAEQGLPESNEIRPGLTLAAWIEAEMVQEGTETDDCQQKVNSHGNPDSGTWKIRLDLAKTEALQFDCSAADVQAELEALPAVGTGNVTCTGGPLDSAEIEIEFLVPTITVEVMTVGSTAANGKQKLTIDGNPSTRPWRIKFGEAFSAELRFTATASDIQEALEAMEGIGAGNVTCTSGPIDTTPVEVEFVGELARQEIDELEIDQDFATSRLVPLFGLLAGGDLPPLKGEFGYVAKMQGALGSESRQYETAKVYNRFRDCEAELQCLYGHTGRGLELIQVECEGG